MNVVDADWRISKMQDNIVISNKSFTSSENPITATGYYVWNSNYNWVWEQRVMASQPGCLPDISSTAHSVLVQHCTAGLWNEIVIGLKNGGNFHRSYEPESVATEWSPRLFTPPNHKRVMPASCKPCLIPHQQSQSHRARTVESSRISDTLVSSRMVSPVKWKLRKEPYQLNFKQNCYNINVIYTIINTKNCIIIIITFQRRYVRKDSNYYDIAQNIYRKMFLAIFSIIIRYAILRFNTYTNPKKLASYIYIYIYIYIDPIYSILYQYISSPVMLPNVLMYIDLYFFLQNITDYQTYLYSKA